MQQLTTKAIILRRTNYNEADRIISLLSPDYGKLQVMAKGVRRQKSKLAGGIELFSVSEIQFIKGKRTIDTLVSTRLITYYDHIVQDYDRTQRAYDALKIIQKITEDKGGSEYFAVLDETLQALNQPQLPTILSELSFLVRLLNQFGHLPDFTTDVAGAKLDQAHRYHFDHDQVAFVRHPQGDFDKNHIKVLKLLAHNSPWSLRSVGGIANYCQPLLPIIRSHSQYYM
jgi:DNA repair protein RecO (recombination protein O)